MTNSIMEALESTTYTRDALARELAAYCRNRATTCFDSAADNLHCDCPEEAVPSYFDGLEWESRAARILESVVFKREPEFTREQRQALLRMIGGRE